jgi:NADH:ubiquinone oxidoreductase subunit 5 (subunit L)/multisubunit Na+/H+ antiporter MnhA subunit
MPAAPATPAPHDDDSHHAHHAHAGPAAVPADMHHAHAAHEHEDEHAHHGGLHESPWSMTVPLAILGTMAIIGALVVFVIAQGGISNLIHPAEHTLEAAAHSTGVSLETIEAAEGEHAGSHGLVEAIIEPFGKAAIFTTAISLVAAIAGIALAWAWWKPDAAEDRILATDKDSGMYRVWSKRYYFDQVYDRVFGFAVLRQAEAQDRFDSEVIDGAVNGLATASNSSGERLRRWNTGFVQDYALTALFGLIVIMLIVIYAPQIPGLWERARDMVGGA